MIQESLTEIMNVPEWKRAFEMQQYAKKLLTRDISHCLRQCENRKCLTANLERALLELQDEIDFLL